MRAIILMFDSLNRRMVPPYSHLANLPNFARLAERSVAFDRFYAGSLPCMPARRELHTGRHNFLHRSWGPLEPFDDSMPEMLAQAGVHTHLASDHQHYWEDGGATYHTRYSTWEFFRGQEGDPWKGVVDRVDPRQNLVVRMRSQDEINRTYMATEAEHSQTRTVDAGIEFIATNARADRWMLQLELFDPHEPFFAAERFRERRGLTDEPVFDWPPYQKVTEDDADVRAAREEYRALLDMCDASLGRVLDAMDEHALWDDTLLIVNTDHGFMLGERGWWSKSIQPWYNELVHLPMYLWDPRSGRRNERDDRLVRTIDIPVTVLDFFGISPTSDMQGQPLSSAAEAKSTTLFGKHGEHVNITDGRYVYMRSSARADNTPLEEFTLMPTHMRWRFSPGELAAWEPAEAFSFTKGLRTIRVEVAPAWLSSWQHGTQLFDLESDPDQRDPIVDDAEELRMAQMLVEAMRENDAPLSQFERLGLPATGNVGTEHLLAGAHRERVLARSEALPRLSELAAPERMLEPLARLLSDVRACEIVRRHAPDLVDAELVGLPPTASLLTIAARAGISAAAFRALDADLAGM
ncbi:sulfatase [Nocardioides sp.]|uniref:sulfatase n=1 Tax=Nocardioides sp. TaxID=35761 RepID=UPI0019B74430|nr:sulfatase [Nocardioides sp.]MBC7278086.1 sulfatase [Nocardioides sp.]